MSDPAGDPSTRETVRATAGGSTQARQDRRQTRNYMRLALLAVLTFLALVLILFGLQRFGIIGQRGAGPNPNEEPLQPGGPAAGGSGAGTLGGAADSPTATILPAAAPAATAAAAGLPAAAPAATAAALGGGGGAAPAAPVVPVADRFTAFYNARGGVRLLGNPISAPLEVNGRSIQWFERARLEYWPEFAGTPYEVQLGRLGAEYTSGRSFPTQSYFVSRPDLRFFAETGHAVGGRFLAFWEQNGGLPTFGLPISEEFDEVLPDGRAYRVQYFERARLEYHPQLAGTPSEIQLGLLGTALYQNESRPSSIPPAPTQVPLP